LAGEDAAASGCNGHSWRMVVPRATASQITKP
jgi:hypothetical protein